MIVTFILGAVAAWAAAMAEPHLRRVIEGPLAIDPATVGAVELRVLTLAVCLLAAAILAALIGSAGAVPLALGAVAGAAVPWGREKLRAARTPDYDA